VPLQVYNSMQVEEERALLRQIKHLIIGGGAVSSELAAELKHFPNAVWSTYGMTETLSHIALRRLSGEDATDWYEPFEGVKVSLDEAGCLVIDAPAVCAKTLVTNDIAEIATDGCHFRIRGRLTSFGVRQFVHGYEHAWHFVFCEMFLARSAQGFNILRRSKQHRTSHSYGRCPYTATL
jgi:acyl-CoA synthetase (AMP-forming)/AMP-acid ligase II